MRSSFQTPFTSGAEAGETLPGGEEACQIVCWEAASRTILLHTSPVIWDLSGLQFLQWELKMEIHYSYLTDPLRMELL
jgi:hypothetical protein